jgi:hypothetical protein
MAIIRPKKATKTVNRTLSESMKTPAVMLGEIQAVVDINGPSVPEKTSGTSENAKTAVAKLIITTK